MIIMRSHDRFARIRTISRQNSLDVAWDLLMAPEYKELRSTIFVNRSEMLRFRQVTVNVVLGKLQISFFLSAILMKREDSVLCMNL